MVRAKFKCTKKEETAFPGEFNIGMEPVMDDSAENKAFFSATPWGTIDMGIVNGAAAEQFVPGKEYYVDFTPCEE